MTPSELIINTHFQTNLDEKTLQGLFKVRKQIELSEFINSAKRDYENFYNLYYEGVFEPISNAFQEIRTYLNNLQIKVKVEDQDIIAHLIQNGKEIPNMTMITYDKITNIYCIDILIPDSGNYILSVFSMIFGS
jgi:hypothetical protein